MKKYTTLVAPINTSLGTKDIKLKESEIAPAIQGD
jgi:hypothetical protein